MLKQFRTWLHDRRHFVFSWYDKDSQETQEPERSLIELPKQLRSKLVEAVENLPSNSADKKAIASTLDEAFGRWQEDPSNANNSVVILSNPVIAVSKILSETLKEWTDDKQLPLRLFPLTARPYSIETIKSKLEHHLKNKSDDNDNSQATPEIVVVPNLGWCFLRSLNGLEGIEYLQSLLCDGNKNRFWIIGGGQVGWEYLNAVCALEAYCGDVFVLPAISSEELEAWLEPIINKLQIGFDDPRIDKQILEGDKDNKTHYFDLLADLSEGVSTVAVQMFLKSISYEEDPEDKENKPQSQPDALVAQTPKLEELPSNFESADQYLLYSLLLHGDLRISSLAESLGDSEEEVQARVQLLRRQGIVEQRNNILKVNPIYYPQLKRRLAGNNFIINRES